MKILILEPYFTGSHADWANAYQKYSQHYIEILSQRDRHYGFINYSSVLAADAVFFNSQFHKESFLKELYRFLKHFPDHRELENVKTIAAKSSVLHLGLDLVRFDQYQPEADLKQGQTPLLLWNHRWEYDKNPRDFFRALFILNEQGYDFNVAILAKYMPNL